MPSIASPVGATAMTAISLAVAWTTVAPAQDIGSGTMALLYDAVNGPPAESVDPAILAVARKLLQEEHLLSATRVATPEPDIADIYGKALLLGPRARDLLADLAAIRNVAIRRDREATAAGIARLFAKIGRAPPDEAQMQKFVDAVIGAGANEGPEETVRRRFEKPGRVIEITDARRAGRFTIEVTSTPPGGQPQRTVVTAEKTVKPNAANTGLEQRAVPVEACTITEADVAARRAGLNGAWKDQNGANWQISGAAEQITLVERRPGRPVLTYVGSYKLGRIEATHRVAAPNEILGTLPDWVRAGLVGRTSFVVRLDDCGKRSMQGTWESRHVTYNPAFTTIDRIHDPYDLSLALRRAGDLKTARGGRMTEDGP